MLLSESLLAILASAALHSFRAPLPVTTDPSLKFFTLGVFALQSGERIRDCKIGYRTFGKLNTAKDNAVLVPTWYLGTTADMANSFGPGGLVDSSKYYVIAVDSLGDGVSSSPSTSLSQHDASFPRITVRDMVGSEHQLVIGLGINHLKAVVGISMGGIQTFTWLTAFPDFLDKAVPIVGSPRASSYDLMFAAAGLKAMRAAVANPGASSDLIRCFADFFWMDLTSPAYTVKHTSREAAAASFAGFEHNLLAWDTYL